MRLGDRPHPSNTHACHRCWGWAECYDGNGNPECVEYVAAVTTDDGKSDWTNIVCRRCGGSGKEPCADEEAAQ